MKKRTRKIKNDIYEDDFDGTNVDDLITVKNHGLPSPAQIAESLKKNRVTLMLDNAVVDFFRQQARKYNVGYQQMIREVLRSYISRKKDVKLLF